MKELVEVIAKALVDNPDEVVVTETQKDEEIVIELKVAAADMARSSASREGLRKLSALLLRPQPQKKTKR